MKGGRMNINQHSINEMIETIASRHNWEVMFFDDSIGRKDNEFLDDGFAHIIRDEYRYSFDIGQWNRESQLNKALKHCAEIVDEVLRKFKPRNPKVEMKRYNVTVKQVYQYHGILAENKEQAIDRVISADWHYHDYSEQDLEISARIDKEE